MSGRNPGTLGVWGPSGTRVVAIESMWNEPLKWDRAAAKAGERHRVFCASLADVFEDWAGSMVDSSGKILDHSGPWQFIGNPHYDPLGMSSVRMRLGRLIDDTHHLDWLLLTKRPEKVVDMCEDHMFGVNDKGEIAIPDNVWVGTSVEDQEAADYRIPHLLKVPAKVRFLSCEPLLGPVDLTKVVMNDGDSLGSLMFSHGEGNGINWVIVGGESGPGARSMNLSWAKSLVKQCDAAGVPVFVKQLGACPVVTHWDDCRPSNPYDVPWTHRDPTHGRSVGRTKHLTMAGYADKKGEDIETFPSELRVQEFPAA